MEPPPPAGDDASSSPAPPLKLYLREREGLSLLALPAQGGGDAAPQASLSRVPCSSAVFSADGALLALVGPAAVRLIDTRTGRERASLPVPNVTAAAFSPRGTYLQTFQKVTAAGQKNVRLQPLDGGPPVLEYAQKALNKQNWPAIQISEDESVACRVVTGEVHFYDASDFAKGIVARLKAQALSAAQLSLSPPSHLAAFVPELKGAPASVRIYSRASIVAAGATPPAPAARRSFYKSSTVRLMWNRGASALLALAHSDVDKTNQSYYGESTLHFLASDGSFEGSVPLSKEGPIHDVQWSPSGSEFVVVHGYMPAKATLFNAKCKPLYDFGEGPRNMVRWSPHARFFFLAGFGNLPGDMEFWERDGFKQLGKTRAPCTVTAEWAPNGRHVMTATTSPRLQVDNGYKLLKYDGSLLFQKPLGMLYTAEWAPAAEGVYADLPASPRSSASRAAAGAKAGAAAAATAAFPATGANGAKHAAKQPAAYRPPHSSFSGGSTRTQLLGEHAKPHRIGEAPASSGPGGDSKSAAKNKKRREKEKEKALLEGAPPPSSATSRDEAAVTEQLRQLAPPSAASSAPAPGEGAAAGGAGEVSKRLRALNKKLRQLEEVKKKAAEGGAAAGLTPEQKEKLAQEAALRQEIADLEAQL